MQGQLLELIGDPDALVDLFEPEAEEIFMQLGAERRLPVDQAADEQLDTFLVRPNWRQPFSR